MNDYIQLALRTEAVELSALREPRLTHAAIGVMTEVVELAVAAYMADHVNMKEEIGDTLWYLAIACDELECTMDELRQISTVDREAIKYRAAVLLHEAAAAALDLTKKNLFYGKPIDPIQIGKCLGDVLVILDHIVERESWSIDDLMATNIEKLKTRYPEKFTSEAAENRDLAAERKVLEQ